MIPIFGFFFIIFFYLYIIYKRIKRNESDIEYRFHNNVYENDTNPIIMQLFPIHVRLPDDNYIKV